MIGASLRAPVAGERSRAKGEHDGLRFKPAQPGQDGEHRGHEHARHFAQQQQPERNTAGEDMAQSDQRCSKCHQSVTVSRRKKLRATSDITRPAWARRVGTESREARGQGSLRPGPRGASPSRRSGAPSRRQSRAIIARPEREHRGRIVPHFVKHPVADHDHGGALRQIAGDGREGGRTKPQGERRPVHGDVTVFRLQMVDAKAPVALASRDVRDLVRHRGQVPRGGPRREPRSRAASSANAIQSRRPIDDAGPARPGEPRERMTPGSGHPPPPWAVPARGLLRRMGRHGGEEKGPIGGVAWRTLRFKKAFRTVGACPRRSCRSSRSSSSPTSRATRSARASPRCRARSRADAVEIVVVDNSPGEGPAEAGVGGIARRDFPHVDYIAGAGEPRFRPGEQPRLRTHARRVRPLPQPRHGVQRRRAHALPRATPRR